MLQFRPGESLARGTMRHWRPRPFGSYAFVADRTPGVDCCFSVNSHWHPSSVLEWLGPEAYRVRLDDYSRHVDYLFNRTVFDPDLYYACAHEYPKDENRWVNRSRSNRLDEAAFAAAEGVRLALQSCFYGCITTHEYSLAVLADEELEALFCELDRLLRKHERIPQDYDAVAAYMDAHSCAELSHCETDGSSLRMTLSVQEDRGAGLWVTVYWTRNGRIEAQRVRFSEPYGSPCTLQMRWHCAG